MSCSLFPFNLTSLHLHITAALAAARAEGQQEGRAYAASTTPPDRIWQQAVTARFLMGMQPTTNAAAQWPEVPVEGNNVHRSVQEYFGTEGGYEMVDEEG